MNDREFTDLKLRVRDGNPIRDVIGTKVELRERGRHFVGLCPFHEEKTPSFTVFPDTQHFKCFGCGRTGDVFTFLMERHDWTFRQALNHLARNLGMEMPLG